MQHKRDSNNHRWSNEDLGAQPCYNSKEKSLRGSRHESVAIKRPTNAIKSIVGGQETNLLREVSNKQEKDLPDVPQRPCKPQDELQELQSLPVEGESWDSKQRVAGANAMAAGMSGNIEVVRKTANV